MINLKKVSFWALGASISAVLISSCVKEKYDFSKVSVRNWAPNLAMPLVNSTLTINDILVNADKEGAIQVGSDGFCTLVYKDRLFSEKAENFINIPGQGFGSTFYDFSNTVTVSSFNSAANGTVFGPYVKNLTYTLSTSYQIDSLYLKPGTNLTIVYNNSLPADVEVTVTSNSLKEIGSGNTFSRVFTINQGTATSITFDIGNHILNLNDGFGNRNVFKLNYSARLTKKANASGSESLSLNTGLTNIKFSTFIGYIGTLVNVISPYQDTVGISIFKNTDNLMGGTFYVEDPSVVAKITNYLGCNVQLSFSKLDAFTPGPNGVNTNFNSLAGTSVTQNIFISKATTFTSPGVSNVNVTKNNTPSVVPFINSQPKNVIYKVNAITNPGSFGYTRNFFNDTSRFAVDFDIVMPLWGRASGFTMRDTQDVNMSGLEMFNSVNVRTYFENQFPVEIEMSLIYVDSLYQPVATLVPSGSVVMKGATVSTSGQVVAPTITQKDYTLTRADILALKKAKKLLILARANTTGGGSTNVKIYNFYKLNVRLGIQAQPLINLSTGN